MREKVGCSVSANLSREGGDRYAGKRLVIRALADSIKTSKSDKYFRERVGLKQSQIVTDAVRESVAMADAKKIYPAICKVFLEAVVNGDGLRLDGIGRIFLRQSTTEKEVRWLDNYGRNCVREGDDLGPGQRRMYKLETTPAGYYAWVTAHFLDLGRRLEFYSQMIAVGWGGVVGVDSPVYFGPVKEGDFIYFSEGLGVMAPWIDGQMSPVAVSYQRRIKEYGPGAQQNKIWICRDDEYGPGCVVAVMYKEQDSKYRVFQSA